MGYESGFSREERNTAVWRPPAVVPGGPPPPIGMYVQRRLQRSWVSRRLKHEVGDLMRHAENLRLAAMGPPDEMVVSLQNARTVLTSLRAEIEAWGLLEVRQDDPGARVAALLECDFSSALSRNGITLDWSVQKRLQKLHRVLLQHHRAHTATPDGDGGLKDLLELALATVDEFLEDRNVNDSRWRERARRMLGLIAELITTLVIALAAVGLVVLAVDEPLVEETIKRIIEVLTGAVGLRLAGRVLQEQPHISAVLSVADKEIRIQSGNLLAISKRVGFRRPLDPPGEKRVKQLAACLNGHVYTVTRLLEIAEDWPQGEDYVVLCTRLSRLANSLAAEIPDASPVARWRIRRTTVAQLNKALLELGGFRIPDELALKAPVRRTSGTG